MPAAKASTASRRAADHTGILPAHVLVGHAARGRIPLQIVLRWHVQQGLVPIPMSSDPQRLRSNLDVFGFALSNAEMADVSALDRGEQAAVDSDEFGH
ncbi:aldo/keto reductase [Actinoplanes sp. NPDC051513]|uniref:aldo/keto reductase n=1 Tax=Actinoplanes sp. NPDC051513 TaxID=3363908 RepID=UPI00378B72AA